MRSFDVHASANGAGTTLRLRGPFRVDEAQALRDELRRATGAIEPGKAARFDLSSVEEADGAAIAVLVQLQPELQARGVKFELFGAKGGLVELLGVYSGGATRASAAHALTSKDVLARIGSGSLRLLEELRGWLAFLGATLIAASCLVRKPREQNWMALPPLMERAGAGAAPMVLLINGLLGVVAAHEYDLATRPLGASIYAPAFAGLSVMRELAPLMTAVVVAEKTGAGFTAELGTMKVSQEIDALRALGIDPIGFLVLPRMAALVLTLPLLTLMADGAGLVGGLLVATLKLDMGIQEYLREVQDGLSAHDIVFGLSKSAAFGVAIAFIACRQGLAVAGSLTSVSRRTAAALVSILFATVLIDALFPRGS